MTPEKKNHKFWPLIGRSYFLQVEGLTGVWLVTGFSVEKDVVRLYNPEFDEETWVSKEALHTEIRPVMNKITYELDDLEKIKNVFVLNTDGTWFEIPVESKIEIPKLLWRGVSPEEVINQVQAARDAFVASNRLRTQMKVMRGHWKYDFILQIFELQVGGAIIVYHKPHELEFIEVGHLLRRNLLRDVTMDSNWSDFHEKIVYDIFPRKEGLKEVMEACNEAQKIEQG